MESIYKPLCKLGGDCPAFVRFIDNDRDQDEDMEHCSKYIHPTRRGGMRIEDNFQSKFLITAFQSCIKTRAHQRNRNFWFGKVNNGDLEAEVKKNGFAEILTSSLYDSVKKKLEHEKHRLIGLPLSFNQMFAILLYTDTKLYRELRIDECLFSMKDVTSEDECTYEQKWPIFGRILNSAICCLNKHDRSNRPTTVYHGLHGIEVDPTKFNNSGYEIRPKNNPFFKYGTFISASRREEVALAFMNMDSDVDTVSSMLVIDTRKDEDGNEIIGADVSWISKFPDEDEFLIARLAQFGINNIQYHPQLSCYIVNVSVEFFAHRGQMCFSTEHDSDGCNCDFKPGPRPPWIPLPDKI
ncbi:hypothetical protein I4U23_017239 [Adineta vaga]|nr:hypothetical protein I4U23_017239 [Adineta vaga]